MCKELKNVKKLLKGSESAFLMITRNGAAIVGTTPEVLAQLTTLVSNLVEAISKEEVEEAIRLGLMPANERIEELGKRLNEILDKIINKEDNEK